MIFLIMSNKISLNHPDQIIDDSIKEITQNFNDIIDDISGIFNTLWN